MQDWGNIDKFQNLFDMWAEWKRIFLFCADKHAPLKTKRVLASKSSWINSNLKHEMYNRDVLKMKAIRSKEPSDWVNFKKHRN